MSSRCLLRKFCRVTSRPSGRDNRMADAGRRGSVREVFIFYPFVDTEFHV